ncbi:ATP-binding cassette domain-containing protein, partial [archaeon]
PTSTLSSSLASTGQYFGTGALRFNGMLLRASELRNKIAYVQQFDFHLPSLTVYETLLFHARLRVNDSATSIVGSSLPKSDAIRKRVYEVLYTLNLVACMHVRVGDEVNKGISGGEKRRLSIAVQLLVSPAVCLLDEPTTGLDAYTARRVVHLLRHIAHTPYTPAGFTPDNSHSPHTNIRTVILSIHQPRYDIFACFDDVILLSKGQLVYAGNVEDMYTHFEHMGLPFPDLCNPADYLLDVSSIDVST